MDCNNSVYMGTLGTGRLVNGKLSLQISGQYVWAELILLFITLGTQVKGSATTGSSLHGVASRAGSGGQRSFHNHSWLKEATTAFTIKIRKY